MLILKAYKNSRDFNANRPSISNTISDAKEFEEKASRLFSEGYYQCVAEDERGNVYKRYNNSGGKYTYLSSECLELVNTLLQSIIAKNSVEKTATLSFQCDEEGFFILTRKDFTQWIDLDQKALTQLSALESQAHSEGFTGIESILFTPRRVGKFKSGCFAPSKTEQGSARITVDMH